MKKHRKRVKHSSRRSRSGNQFQRSLLLFAILTAVVITVVGVVRSRYFDRSVQGQADRPNFLVIMTDDQRADSELLFSQFMPQLNSRIQAKGVTFTKAYATTPLCCPSRSSFFSGKFAHNHGVWLNEGPNGGFSNFNDTETLPKWLKSAGYQTAFYGKYLNGYEDNKHYVPNKQSKQWNEWHAFAPVGYYNYDMNDNGDIHTFGNRVKDYSTDVLRNKAVAFLKGTTEPFFLYFAPKAPHGEGANEASGLNPPKIAPRHSKNCTVPAYITPPSFNEADVSDKPQWIQKRKTVNAKDVAVFRRAQLCSLLAVDDAIGAMLDVLESTGRLNNTVVVFIGDNGFAYGEHRYTEKNCLYEECARVPLVISYPPITGSAGKNGSLVNNIDVVSTILDFAGVAAPTTINGTSLTPLLTDPSGSVRDHMLLEVFNRNDGYKAPDYAIVTGQHKYTELSTGEKELYDLLNDQYELDNIVNDPAQAETVQGLSDRLQPLKTQP